jgi:cobalt-zinc-cadmium efflux system membrane fusion protein
MKNTTYHTLFGYHCLLFITLWMSCASPSKPSTGHENEEHQHEKQKNKEEVHLVQQQMEVMDIELDLFQELNLSTTVKANGQLELPPQNKANLSSMLGGRVKRIMVLEGDFVKQGQTLAYLEHPNFLDLQQQYMMAFSELKYKQQEYERKSGLFKDSISSGKSLQEAEATYLSALAQHNGLKAKLELMDMDTKAIQQGQFSSTIPIRSPINGYVRLIEINVGRYVQPEEELFEIVDNEHIHIDLMVYEKDMDKVKKGQSVIFSLTNHSSGVFTGRIFAVGKSFEKGPKAMMVHAEIDNKTGNLLPGMYVDARIVTNTSVVNALPNDAIVSDGGLNYIFVLKPRSTSSNAVSAHQNEYVFRKIEVSTGASDIGFTEAVPVYDLPPHIKVVSKGAFYLLAEMKKGEGGHGHHH